MFGAHPLHTREPLRIRSGAVGLTRALARVCAAPTTAHTRAPTPPPDGPHDSNVYWVGVVLSPGFSSTPDAIALHGSRTCMRCSRRCRCRELRLRAARVQVSLPPAAGSSHPLLPPAARSPFAVAPLRMQQSTHQGLWGVGVGCLHCRRRHLPRGGSCHAQRSRGPRSLSIVDCSPDAHSASCRAGPTLTS